MNIIDFKFDAGLVALAWFADTEASGPVRLSVGLSPVVYEIISDSEAIVPTHDALGAFVPFEPDISNSGTRGISCF